MLSDEERNVVDGMLRTLQIIIAAMVLGLGAYLAVVLLQHAAPAKQSTNLALMAVAMTVSCGVAAIIVPRVIAAKQRQALVDRELTPLPGTPASSVNTREAGALLADYQVRQIIMGALLEGPGFFNVTAYQMEREAYTLGIVVAILIALAMLIPTRGRVERWLEDELRTVRELRQLRG